MHSDQTPLIVPLCLLEQAQAAYPSVYFLASQPAVANATLTLTEPAKLNRKERRAEVARQRSR